MKLNIFSFFNFPYKSFFILFNLFLIILKFLFNLIIFTILIINFKCIVKHKYYIIYLLILFMEI